MAITALPTAPQRTDSPDIFATKADSWVAALDTFTPEANALQADVNAKQLAAAASEIAAELAKTNAETAQAASESARDLSIANASGTVATGSAKDWASKTENSAVISGQYSALHWAAKAAASVASLPAGTINDLLITNDTAWSSQKINAELLIGRKIEISDKTGSYTVLDTDRSKIIRCTNTFTLSLPSAVTLGSGWFCYVQNIGAGNITIDPYSSETIDSQANVILEPDNLFLILSTGTELKCIRLNKPQPHYITTSETWVVPAGVYLINVEIRGGGGCGGAGLTNTQNIGCSGGQGGYSIKKIKTTPGSSKSITIGAGGGYGQVGGTTSFSSDFSASGGSVGLSASTGTYKAAGGTSSGGDINITGEAGYCCNISGYTGISFGGGGENSKGSGGSGAPYGANPKFGIDGLCVIWY